MTYAINIMAICAIAFGVGCHHSSGSSSDLGADLAVACVEDALCSTPDPVACHEGRMRCASGAMCTDVDSADGTTCNEGLCTLGVCRAPQTITGSVDLSAMSITPGRTCAEAPPVAVVALDVQSVTLATAPTSDCLVAGDEVLLINLQGATGMTGNVGNWELLRVASIAGSTVTFTSARTRHYGSADDDTGIGPGADQQKVELVRVPQFGELTVTAGAIVTTSGWSGQIGGVLAMRAAHLILQGSVSVAGLGYRGGRWSDDDSDCSDSVQTESGESIDGAPVISTDSHAGAPGGISASTGDVFTSNTPMNAGAGHATGGDPGLDTGNRIVGMQGGAYGVNDATKLTMGSGASGNMTCHAGAAAAPVLVSVEPTLAGGIALLLTATIEVADTGAVRADAVTSSRDISASGGYVFIRGTALSLGGQLVSALGGVATNNAGIHASMSVKSSAGYVVLKGTAVTGVTAPSAHVL